MIYLQSTYANNKLAKKIFSISQCRKTNSTHILDVTQVLQNKLKSPGEIKL